MKYKVKVVVPWRDATALFRDGKCIVHSSSEKGIFLVESNYKDRIDTCDLLKQTGLTKHGGFPSTIYNGINGFVVEPIE
jgi:hypothetical protein